MLDEDCPDCGAAAEEYCDPDCVTRQPTGDELAQDWLDVGTL